MGLIESVRLFATAAHAAVGQKRKYTNEDYIVHPIEVVNILKKHGIHDDDILSAAFLHDVVEDTHITIDLINCIFGSKISKHVDGMTDKTNLDDGNRQFRKNSEKIRLSNESSTVQTIKVADIISNTRDIFEHDKEFAKVYLTEAIELLAVLTKADESILETANKQIKDLSWKM